MTSIIYGFESEYVVSRVYPTLDGSDEYSIEANADVHVQSLSVYRMRAIWDHFDDDRPGEPGQIDATPRYGDVATDETLSFEDVVERHGERGSGTPTTGPGVSRRNSTDR